MTPWQWLIIAWLTAGFLGGAFELAWNHGVQRVPVPATAVLMFAVVFCAVLGPVEWILLAVQIFSAANRIGRRAALPKSPFDTCIVCSVGVRDWRHDRAMTAVVASACTLRAIARDGASSIDEGLCDFHRDMILAMAEAETEDPIGCLASKPPWAPIARSAKEMAVGVVHYWAPADERRFHVGYVCGTHREAPHRGSCNWANITCPTCLARKPPEAT